MKKVFVAMDIGCIECGEESRCIGIFKTEQEAEAALIGPAEKQRKEWTGQHNFEVFETELSEV